MDTLGNRLVLAGISSQRALAGPQIAALDQAEARWTVLLLVLSERQEAPWARSFAPSRCLIRLLELGGKQREECWLSVPGGRCTCALGTNCCFWCREKLVGKAERCHFIRVTCQREKRVGPGSQKLISKAVQFLPGQ